MAKCECNKCRKNATWRVQTIIVGTLKNPVPPLRGSFVDMCDKHYDEHLTKIMNLNPPIAQTYAEEL